MNSLRMNLEFLRMIRKTHTHSPERINIEMHKIMIMPRDRMVSDDGERNIFVDERKKTGHVFLKHLERVPDVWLGDVFAVCRGVLEFEALAVFGWVVGVVDYAVAIAVAGGVDDAGAVAAWGFQWVLFSLEGGEGEGEGN